VHLEHTPNWHFERRLIARACSGGAEAARFGVLQRQNFTALPGIFLACLAINRGAYVIAIWLKNMDYLPQQVSDDIPHDGRKMTSIASTTGTKTPIETRGRRIRGCDLSSRFTESSRTARIV
jgi:hypothetical protein